MTVFANVFNRIVRNKLQIALIIVLPAVFLIMIALSMSSRDNSLNSGIVDKDRTSYTSILIHNLGTETNLKEINEDDIRGLLVNSKLDYAIVIPEGFTEDLIKGKEVVLEGYYLKESIRSLPIQKYVENFINSSRQISSASKGNEKNFYAGMEAYKNGVMMKYSVVKDVNREKSYMTFGMMVMFMLMSSILFTTLLLTDKENKTFYRSISAPVSVKSYMLQNIMAFVLISILQATTIFIVLKTVVGLYMGDSAIKLYLFFTIASLVCVSFGIAVSSMSKSVMQACFAGLFIIFPMTFLGGCWWRNELSIDLIRNIGKFTPVYWIMEGVNKLLNEQSLQAIAGEVLMLLIFSSLLFFLGTWRKEDVAK